MDTNEVKAVRFVASVNGPVLARLRKKGQPVQELVVVYADVAGFHAHAPARYLVAVREKTEVRHE